MLEIEKIGERVATGFKAAKIENLQYDREKDLLTFTSVTQEGCGLDVKIDSEGVMDIDGLTKVDIREFVTFDDLEVVTDDMKKVSSEIQSLLDGDDAEFLSGVRHAVNLFDEDILHVDVLEHSEYMLESFRSTKPEIVKFFQTNEFENKSVEGNEICVEFKRRELTFQINGDGELKTAEQIADLF